MEFVIAWLIGAWLNDRARGPSKRAEEVVHMRLIASWKTSLLAAGALLPIFAAGCTVYEQPAPAYAQQPPPPPPQAEAQVAVATPTVQGQVTIGTPPPEPEYVEEQAPVVAEPEVYVQTPPPQ